MGKVCGTMSSLWRINVRHDGDGQIRSIANQFFLCRCFMKNTCCLRSLFILPAVIIILIMYVSFRKEVVALIYHGNCEKNIFLPSSTKYHMQCRYIINELAEITNIRPARGNKTNPTGVAIPDVFSEPSKPKYKSRENTWLSHHLTTETLTNCGSCIFEYWILWPEQFPGHSKFSKTLTNTAKCTWLNL